MAIFESMNAFKKTLIGTASLATLGGLYLTSGYGHLQRSSPAEAQAAVASTPPQAATAPLPGTSSGSLVGSNVFVEIADRLMPSVVNIFTTQTVRARPFGMPGGDPWGGLFGRGWGGGPWEMPEDGEMAHPPRGHGDGKISRPMSLGTGFVIEASDGGGLILTNHHVIAGADEVKVKFTEAADENESPAEVVGKDPELDIALLKVKTSAGAGEHGSPSPRKLVPVALGDSERLKVGEWVAAIGNPFGHGHSVSHGIVSAKARSLPGGFGKYLQTDTPINPGNSGGPLVNLAGEVIGINNAIDARGPGIGFAIPINSVKALLPQLKSEGRVDRGFIGINIMPLKPELARALKAEGVQPGAPVIADVMPGQPAAKAGLEPYDVISKVDGQPVRSPDELMAAITQVPVGKQIKAEVIRGGKTQTIGVTVARRPDPRRT